MPSEGGPALHQAPNTTTSGTLPGHASNDAHFNTSSGSSAAEDSKHANVSGLVIHSGNVTVTAQTSAGGEDDGAGLPGGVIALMLCLLLVGVAVFCIIFYLKRTGKLYKVIPFKRLASAPRRSSFSSSDRALHMKGAAHDDDDDEDDMVGDVYTDRSLPPSSAVASARRHHHHHHHNNNNSSSRGGGRGGGGGSGGGGGGGGGREVGRAGEREADSMFTIEDHDMDSVDIGDGTSRGTNDEYYYDEVFGKSMFEDEVTNASMRELYLASEEAEDADIVDVDAIVDSITGKKPKVVKT